MIIILFNLSSFQQYVAFYSHFISAICILFPLKYKNINGISSSTSVIFDNFV